MEHVPTLKLAGGDALPSVGLGMWKVEKPRVPALLEEAVQCGYRHFDCACDYGNDPGGRIGNPLVIGNASGTKS